jgi:hypothetical protein
VETTQRGRQRLQVQVHRNERNVFASPVVHAYPPNHSWPTSLPACASHQPVLVEDGAALAQQEQQKQEAAQQAVDNRSRADARV